MELTLESLGFELLRVEHWRITYVKKVDEMESHLIVFNLAEQTVSPFVMYDYEVMEMEIDRRLMKVLFFQSDKVFNGKVRVGDVSKDGYVYGSERIDYHGRHAVGGIGNKPLTFKQWRDRQISLREGRTTKHLIDTATKERPTSLETMRELHAASAAAEAKQKQKQEITFNIVEDDAAKPRRSDDLMKRLDDLLR